MDETFDIKEKQFLLNRKNNWGNRNSKNLKNFPFLKTSLKNKLEFISKPFTHLFNQFNKEYDIADYLFIYLLIFIVIAIIAIILVP
jgi:hypothetical protein